MNYKQKNTVVRSKKPIVVATFIALLLLSTVLVFRLRSTSRSASTAQAPITNPETDKIDMSPPSEEEKKATEEHKQELLKQEEIRNQTPPASGRAVTPIITNAGFYDNQVEISAFVPGIYEDSGTCTATLTQGSAQVNKQSPGLKDATTTRCANFVIPRSEFSSAGTWTLIVTYSSATARGASEERQVTVQ